MQTNIATFSSSGKVITFDDGVFFVDGIASTVGRVIEYDELGTLTWVSDEMRSWAYQVSSGIPDSGPTPKRSSTRARGSAAYELGRWIGKNRVLAVLLGLLVLALAGWMIGSALGPGPTGVVTDVTGTFIDIDTSSYQCGATLRDTVSGESIIAFVPKSISPPLEGDVVAYRDIFYKGQTVQEITRIVKVGGAP